MKPLPTLDAHGHLIASGPAEGLLCAGAVLALTLSPGEAVSALARKDGGKIDPLIAWGAGLHPGRDGDQAAFDPAQFRPLAEKSVVIGEIGLDAASKAPMELQVKNFRAILETAAEFGRPVSVHSQNAVSPALDELERAAPPAVILHFWTGTPAETGRAVSLGFYFSFNADPAAAWTPEVFARVPADRLLFETDSVYEDPPVSIPKRIADAERLAAAYYGLTAEALRLQAWKNFGAIVRRAGIERLLPEGMTDALLRAEAETG